MSPYDSIAVGDAAMYGTIPVQSPVFYLVLFVTLALFFIAMIDSLDVWLKEAQKR